MEKQNVLKMLKGVAEEVLSAKVRTAMAKTF